MKGLALRGNKNGLKGSAQKGREGDHLTRNKKKEEVTGELLGKGSRK